MVAPPLAEPQSVLLVRLGAVGDVVRALPLLHALADEHPDLRIGWAVEELSTTLLREQTRIATLHVLPRKRLAAALRRPWRWPEAFALVRSFVRALRAERYDLALDVHGTLKAALVARLAGARRVIGLKAPGSKEGAGLLYHRALPFPREPLTRVARALFLGRAAGLLGETAPDGLGDDSRVRFGLDFPPERVAAVRAALPAAPGPLVVLFPFASRRGQAKRWPVARHAELGRRLVATGARVLLAWGSPSERAEAEAALAGDAGGVQLAPPTDLVELTELLRQGDLLVTGDTGPMHLAAGVGTRVLALFGPSDARVNRPWGPAHEVVVHEPLAELSVDEVEAAARRLLATTG